MSGGGVTGSFAELEAREAELASLAQVVPDIALNAADRIQTIARADYAAGRGPFGETWARRKKDGALALARPGQTVAFEGSGNRIQGVAEAVLEYHQEGNPRLPQRKVFPAEGEGLPPAWEAAIEAAAAEEMARRGLA